LDNILRTDEGLHVQIRHSISKLSVQLALLR